jgi:hypothetical protein
MVQGKRRVLIACELNKHSKAPEDSARMPLLGTWTALGGYGDHEGMRMPGRGQWKRIVTIAGSGVG